MGHEHDPIENRFLRRARNHEVRRSRRKRHLILTLLLLSLRLAIAGLVLWAGLALANIARTSPRYALRKIHVVGMCGSSREELHHGLSPFYGRNLLELSLREVAEAARRHPWVLEASVRRRLPDAIEVRVRERVPYAVASIDGRLVLVDPSAAILGPAAEVPASVETDLPVISGIESGGEPPKGSLARGIAALMQIEEVAPELDAAISEINVAGEGDLRLVLRAPLRTLWLTDDGVRAQLLRYFKVKDAIALRAPSCRHVDLRFRNRVIVRMDEG